MAENSAAKGAANVNVADTTPSATTNPFDTAQSNFEGVKNTGWGTNEFPTDTGTSSNATVAPSSGGKTQGSNSSPSPTKQLSLEEAKMPEDVATQNRIAVEQRKLSGQQKENAAANQRTNLMGAGVIGAQMYAGHRANQQAKLEAEQQRVQQLGEQARNTGASTGGGQFGSQGGVGVR